MSVTPKLLAKLGEKSAAEFDSRIAGEFDVELIAVASARSIIERAMEREGDLAANVEEELAARSDSAEPLPRLVRYIHATLEAKEMEGH